MPAMSEQRALLLTDVVDSTALDVDHASSLAREIVRLRAMLAGQA